MSQPRYTLHLGDCLDVLRGLDAGSVDAVVTDPPAGTAHGWRVERVAGRAQGVSV